jgi:DNA-binding GntR family transcriptional regulator
LTDPLPKIQRIPLREQISNAIRDAIIKGKFKAGEMIPEHELAAQLGVSRTPIREAIRLLEHQGLVEIRPKNGTFVASLDSEEAVDGLYVRAAMEELAVRQALERLDAQEWDALCEKYEDLLDGLREAVASNDPVAAIEFDVEWHRILIDAARNRSLTRTWQVTGLSNLIWSFEFNLYPLVDEALTSWIVRHEELLKVFRRRDPEACAQAIRFHILRKLSDIESGI